MSAPAPSSATLAKMLDAIASGLTVYIGTAYRVTSFSPKTVARIRAGGHEPFKVGSDGSLLMLAGYSKGKPRFDCISLSNGSLLVGVKAQ